MDRIKTFISDEWLVDNHFYFTAKYMIVAYTNGNIDLVKNKGGFLLCNPRDGIPYLHEKPVSYVEDLNVSLRKFDLPTFNLDYLKSKRTKTYTEEEVYRIVANFCLSVNTESFCGGEGTTTEIVQELKKSGQLNFSTEEKSNI